MLISFFVQFLVMKKKMNLSTLLFLSKVNSLSVKQYAMHCKRIFLLMMMLSSTNLVTELRAGNYAIDCQPGTEAVPLPHGSERNPEDDTLEQYYIDASLKDAGVLVNAATEGGLASYHLFSHGRPGALLLEGQWRGPEAIAEWLRGHNQLAGKEQLNIYGCEFAKGKTGQAAVASLERALGLSVAASDDVTGADGDWELEVGNSANALTISAYPHNLQGFYDCSTILEVQDAGGNVEQYNHTLIVDGITYMVIRTREPYNLPIISGSPAVGAAREVYVAVFDENCTQTLGTYLPGSLTSESPTDIAIDDDNNIIIVGATFSDLGTLFPTTDGTQAFNPVRTPFITKITPTGNLIFQTVVEGIPNSSDSPAGVNADNDAQFVDVGDDGSIFVAIRGSEGATGIFTTDGTTPGTGGDFIIARRYDPSGALIYSTIIDYSEEDALSEMIVNGQCMWLTGEADSPDFATTDGSTLQSADDAFIIKLNPDGTTGLSTLFGGSADEDPWLMVSDGNFIYIVGETRSEDIVTTTGVTYEGRFDNFFALKYDSDGNLVYSTLINADGDVDLQVDEGFSDLVVVNGELYFTGRVDGYPGAIFNTNACTPFVGSGFNDNTAIVKLDASGNLAYASLLGGDYARLFVNDAGEAFVLSETNTIGNNLTTDGSTGTAGEDALYLAKLDADGCICLANYLNDLGPGTNEVGVTINSDVYVDGNTVHFTILDSDLSTDGTVSFPGQGNLATIKYTFCPDPPTLTPADLTPASQDVCRNGLLDVLMGDAQEIDGSGEVPVFINGVPRTQNNIPLIYQWQTADSPAGPWTDVAGPLATQQNFSPPPTGVDIYYRRVTRNFECCGGEELSVSNVAEVLISADVAPDVDAGGVYYSCPGEDVTIGGAPTASGGSGGGYVYDWNEGEFLVANPTVNPTESAIYTVRVTDGAGCVQADQATVVVYSANAGSDQGVCNGASATIGGAPLAGVTIVDEGSPVAGEFSVAYTWTGNTATLSCTNCPKPTATPADGTAETYTLTVTLYQPDGTPCSTMDMVEVTTNSGPGEEDFAGADMVVCVGDEITLGTAAEPGFTYSWSPGVFLSAVDQSTLTLSIPLPDDEEDTVIPDALPNPIIYTVTAEIDGCVTFDQVSVYVIEARADELIESDTMCGPRLVGEVDRTPGFEETYSWRIIDDATTPNTGDNSTFLGSTDVPQVSVSGNNTGLTAYELTVSYTSPSGATGECRDTSYIPPCGCVVVAEIDEGCADFDSGNVGVEARASSSTEGLGSEDFDYSWTPTVGLNRFDSSFVELTDNVARTYTVFASSKIDPSFGCSVEVPVNQVDFSTPAFNVSDVIACPGDPTTIGDPAGDTGFIYQWSPTEGLDDPAIPNPTATIDVSTVYSVIVTNAITGCEFLDTVFVDLGQTAAAGGDIFVCDNGVVTLGNNVDLSAEGYSYSWTPVLAPGDYRGGTNQFSAQPQVFVATDLTFTLEVTGPPPNNCVSTDQVEIIVEPIPTAAVLSDIEFCPSTPPVILGFANADGTGANGVPSGFTYKWSPGALLNDPTLRNPTVNTPLPSGDVMFTVEVVSPSGACSSAEAQQLLLLSTLVVPEVNGGVVCVDETINIGSAANATGPGITYAWTPDDGNLTDATSPNPTFSSSSPGTFTYTVAKDDNGCITTAEVTVGVVEVVAPALANAVICAGESVQLGPDVVDGSLSYQWEPTTGLDDPFTANPVFSGEETTNFTLSVVSSQGCVDEAFATVVVNPPPTFMTSLPDTIGICGPAASGSVVLSATVNPAGNYAFNWTPSDNLSSTSELNPTFFSPGPGSYQYVLEVTDNTTGCSILDTTIVSDAGSVAPTPVDAPFTLCADETATDLTANDATVLDGDDGTVAWYDGDPADGGTLISPATAVNLNTVTDLFARVTTTTGGCTADVDVTVTINPLPTPVDAPFTICADETATDLTASDATVLDGDVGTVAWYDGNPAAGGILIDPATAVNLNTITDLFARVTTTVGSCTADVDVTVNINPLPTVSVAVPFTICSSRSIDLTQDASITPVSLGGTWSTPDGTGTFTTGMDFATASTYVPSPEDAMRGSVTFVLTTNDPAGPCELVSAQVVIEILKVDCGTFPWSGER